MSRWIVVEQVDGLGPSSAAAPFHQFGGCLTQFVTIGDLNLGFGVGVLDPVGDRTSRSSSELLWAAIFQG